VIACDNVSRSRFRFFLPSLSPLPSHGSHLDHISVGLRHSVDILGRSLRSAQRRQAYALYQRVFASIKVAEHRRLKTSVLCTKKDLLEVSAQDHFAKWARLRRKLDKDAADLERMSAEVAALRTTFSLKFNAAIWILTTGAQFTIGWWYRRTPVFYLPRGWFGPFTWWLSLPFAPAGSVSCGVWQMACQRVIGIVERMVREHLTDLDEPGKRESSEGTALAPAAAAEK